MNDVQVFKYNSNEVRMVQMDGEPWWVLKDVCSILEMDTSQVGKVANRLDEDERNQITVMDVLGRKQKTYIVNESGLYHVILRSDKPQAKPFRKWVTNEVLPSIRKHGAYMTPEMLKAVILNPDTMIQLCTALKEETEKRTVLEHQLEKDKPKVFFADAVTASHTSILVGELAKILKQNGMDIGQNRLFAVLRERGYLIKRKGTDWNMPTQRSMEMKLFEIKETVITHADGHTSVNKTVKVTGTGQQYFINLFLKEKQEMPA